MGIVDERNAILLRQGEGGRQCVEIGRHDDVEAADPSARLDQGRVCPDEIKAGPTEADETGLDSSGRADALGESSRRKLACDQQVLDRSDAERVGVQLRMGSESVPADIPAVDTHPGSSRRYPFRARRL